jgi:hypothetical protein
MLGCDSKNLAPMPVRGTVQVGNQYASGWRGENGVVKREVVATHAADGERGARQPGAGPGRAELRVADTVQFGSFVEGGGAVSACVVAQARLRCSS